MNGRRPRNRGRQNRSHPYHSDMSRIGRHSDPFPAERQMTFNFNATSDPVDRRQSFSTVSRSNNSSNPGMPSGRYFERGVTNTVNGEEATHSTSNSSSPRKVFATRKRKFPPSLGADFISLDSSVPASKQSRLNLDGTSDIEDASRLGHSFSNETPSSVSFEDKSDTPYTLKEARRLFMKDPASSQIHDFFCTNHQRESFLKKKHQLRLALEKVIDRTIQRGAHLLLVGSSVNGFGRLTSDADFCLVIDESLERIENRKRMMKTLYSLQQLLRNAPFASRMQVIPAKVPILKFVDSYSGMECDININNLTGIRNTELMKRYGILDPRVQPIALVIKEWAHRSGINDASQGTLSSYSLILMVVHFLQCGMQPPVLPCLQFMHPRLFDVTVPIMDVEKQAVRITPFRSKCKLPLFQLLQRFFEYYAEKFDFDNNVISVRLGKTFDVTSIRHLGKEWNKAIKIEEPFDRSNTARAVYSLAMGEKVFKQFRHANYILRQKNSLDAILTGLPSTSQRPVLIIDD